jgi:spermidine/putrescine transport system ATP-binding protein
LNSFLTVDNLSKSYDGNLILNNVNLNVSKGEFFFLLGPSGCGKTTLLRLISGLISPDSGSIALNGEIIHKLPAHKRDVNTVFQNYALFPHMNVFDNVGFGLRMRKESSSVIKKTVSDMLDLVGLSSLYDRMPSQLSGGQMQRVALARALANKPSLLLLDEPLGALDVKLRKQMQNELRKIQKEVGTTFMCVTHDQEEALTIGDRIALMNAGNLEQVGTSEELYKNPSTHFVCDFLGESNFFEIQSSKCSTNGSIINLYGHSDSFFAKSSSLSNPKILAVRPEMMVISENLEDDLENRISVSISDIRFAGAFYDVDCLAKSGNTYTARISTNGISINLELGAEVYLSWKKENSILLD